MQSRRGTDSPVRGADRRVHYRSGNGAAEPSGAGATFPSGGTGTSFSAGNDTTALEVLALRCLVAYLGPTVATAL